LGISGSFASFNGYRDGAGTRRRAVAFFSLALILLVTVTLALAACSRSERRGKSAGLSKRVVEIGEPVPKGGGRYKVGEPYKVAGRWYFPRENSRYDKVGVASWYGDLFHGRYTANGEIFDMEALTAAHPTLPMPIYAEVTNLENGRKIVVRVNDRGPYAHDRIIDLSKRSARELGIYRPGTAKVRVRYLGKAPLNGDDSFERRVLASQSWTKTKLARNDRRHKRAMTLASTGDPATVGGAGKSGWQTVGHKQKDSPALATAAVRRQSVPQAAPRDGRSPLIFVQAGSFRSEQNADTARERLKGLGPVHVFPAEIAGTMWYRVRVGPFREDGRANEALAKVVASGAAGARIVRN
jgi:rare lipoprotein A